MGRFLTLGLLFLLAASGIVSAQPRPRGHIMERLNRMTPQERERMLKKLPPDRRTAVEERWRHYDELPPEAKDRLRREYNEFQQLPPEKQEEIRKLFHRFSEFPEDRRREMRRELMRLRNMSAERRTARLNSEDFRSDYNEDERNVLERLSEALPGRPPEQ